MILLLLTNKESKADSMTLKRIDIHILSIYKAKNTRDWLITQVFLRNTTRQNR